VQYNVSYTIQLASMNTLLFFFQSSDIPDISTLSLHDALPILPGKLAGLLAAVAGYDLIAAVLPGPDDSGLGNALVLDAEHHRPRSEEHTSELQSRFDLVCRLLLEKKRTAEKTDQIGMSNTLRY